MYDYYLGRAHNFAADRATAAPSWPISATGVGVCQPAAAARLITPRNQHSRFDHTFLRTPATTTTA